MKIAIKLAYRNLIGAGLRTWLNVIVLSFSFVVIIWMRGIINGWNRQAKDDMTAWEIGGGQYWHEKYDPFDPFTLSESHAPVPEELIPIINRGEMEPYLISQGTLYPRGRMQTIIVKGINPKQDIFLLPSQKLDTLITDAIPAVTGSIMARNLNITRGDRMMLQWRDAGGTFDATDIVITEIFSANVPNVDQGQIYISLENLQKMMNLPGEATIITYRDGHSPGLTELDGWNHKTKQELTSSVDELIKVKSVGTSVMYVILLLLAMLGIFDTQVLSIFRRQKEIGTYIALGYTRRQVVGLFTVEGTMNAVLAAIVGAFYGIPFLALQAKTGWTMPMDTSDFGMAIAQTLYPAYSAGLVIMTVIVIMFTTMIVSYWPSRRIARMNPTEALRGKIQ
ncbi:MAG TPA: ABC transporter permease [Bacteroidales bacterium]|nr:ABC transporter permease [Bacteroidales bacterium]